MSDSFIMRGIVLSSRDDGKTVKIEKKHMFIYKKYGKRIMKVKKYKAHDENNDKKIGDIVEIEETRPISKDKKFKVIK